MIDTVKLDSVGGYQVVMTDGTKLSVPNISDNPDCRQVQDWIAQGNTPDPADVVIPPTYADLRLARYKVESDSLYIEALAQSQTDGLPADFTSFDAKVAEIKLDIPKPV